MMIQTPYVVVGSGIFGAVVAERIATVLQRPVLVIEKRSHVGGNSYSAIDEKTGIECHRYGSHIFHTSDERVWRYVTAFTEFTDYRHQVMILSGGQLFFMPINLKTLCDVAGRALTPLEAQQMLHAAQQDPARARNLEEKAIALVGPELYEKFIRGYTKKQWSREPRELPAEIITRLPVRTTFNTDYFSDPHQGVPRDGYFRLFEKLLSNPRIKVLLNTDFAAIRSQIAPGTKVIYTGMIDEYFDRCAGTLEWRALRFEWETLPVQDYQGTTVVNYADESIPFTRIHEFKHYHPERRGPFDAEQTIICREYPGAWKPGENACYPVNTPANQRLLEQYLRLAQAFPDLIFGGRLGGYCYCNMDQAVAAALDCFENRILPAVQNSIKP